VAVYRNDAADPGSPGSLRGTDVMAILDDAARDLWIGTRAGGLDRFDPATGQVRQVLMGTAELGYARP
jgi:ligand-binding sensor domain-containing protein